MKALIDIRQGETNNLEDLLLSLRKLGFETALVDSEACLAQMLETLPQDQVVLWYSSPTVRLIDPIFLVRWAAGQSAFKTIFSNGELLGFYPSGVVIKDGQLRSKDQYWFNLNQQFFDIANPDQLMFTGERVVPHIAQAKVYMEVHLSFYKLFEHLMRGKVLDLACGCGYGTHTITKTADFVIGVDISKEAVHYSSLNYKADNLVFLKSGATDLPFADDSFDNVISIETFEHVEEVEKYISEVHRVLKVGENFGFTTPNGLIHVYKPKTLQERRGYHVWHYDHDEIKGLLSEKFSYEITGSDYNKSADGFNNFIVLCKKI